MYVVCVCMYVVICKIDHCIHIHWCIIMGLGHNDPWVESHMWPQQTWGQRSSRGQWPLVQVFGQKGQCIHILSCIFKSIKYYNDCKSMWSRKQARLVVREPPCLWTCLSKYTRKDMTDTMKHFEQQTSSTLCSVLYLVHPKSSSIFQSCEQLKSDTSGAQKKKQNKKKQTNKQTKKKNPVRQTTFRSGLPICQSET